MDNNENMVIATDELSEDEAVEAPIDTEKHEKFMQESIDRMKKIAAQISYLKAIAGKRSVEYTKEDVEKMFSYLEDNLASCKETFMARFEKQADKSFDFKF